MKTILLLEDDLSLLMLMRRVLKQYRVLTASSAREAIDHFHENVYAIDLLVADLTLPVSSGVSVAGLLRIEKPGLPVILMSGYPVTGWSESDLAALRQLGTESVIVLHKPFQSKLLLSSVGESTIFREAKERNLSAGA